METTKRGDMWILGRHRLLCGDATSREDHERLLGGERAALCLTDPPYGTRKHVQAKDGRIVGGEKRGLCTGLRNPFIPPPSQPFPLILGDEDTYTARAAIPIIFDMSDAQVIWGGNFFADVLPPSRGWIVWDKQNGATSFADGELAWTSKDAALRIYRYRWSGCCRRGPSRLDPRPRVHPTQKSVELHMEILSVHSEHGDIVMDPFGGSGTTLIACEETGRACRMMELSEHYCGVIIERWERLTGLKAERVET